MAYCGWQIYVWIFKVEQAGMDSKMRNLFRSPFVNLVLLGLAVWQSTKGAQYPNFSKDERLSLCYKASSGEICFTTVYIQNSGTVRKTFEEASHWCKTNVPGSSLIVIDGLESLNIVMTFLGRQILENETIVMDAQRLWPGNSMMWSWVNDHPTVPNDVPFIDQQDHDGGCIELKNGQSMNYCSDNVSSQYSYICELSDPSQLQRRGRYIVREERATWFYARNECLRLRGDLASATDLQIMTNRNLLSILKDNQRYWIGLHRNKWIWNSTGAAITYTNWAGGYPDESVEQRCICINPRCWAGSIECDPGRTWWACNCNNKYAVVCQKAERQSAAVTQNIFIDDEMLSTAFLPGKTTTTDSTSSLNPSNRPSEYPETAFISSSTGVLLILLPIVTVILIIIAVIVVIRKRKYERREHGSPTNNTQQSEAIAAVYATVVAENRPSKGTAPSAGAIYADVEMIQQPTPTKGTIYASVQPTGEVMDMGRNVVYADLDLP